MLMRNRIAFGLTLISAAVLTMSAWGSEKNKQTGYQPASYALAISAGHQLQLVSAKQNPAAEIATSRNQLVCDWVVNAHVANIGLRCTRSSTAANVALVNN